MIKRLYPELEVGLFIQYIDKNEKSKSEKIIAREGNTITVINGLKQRTRISIERVKGYWKPDMKPSPQNLIRLIGDAEKLIENRRRKTHKTIKIGVGTGNGGK